MFTTVTNPESGEKGSGAPGLVLVFKWRLEPVVISEAEITGGNVVVKHVNKVRMVGEVIVKGGGGGEL